MPRQNKLVILLPVLAIALLPLVYLDNTLDPVLMPRFTFMAGVAFLSVLGFLFIKTPSLSFPRLPLVFLSIFLVTGVISGFAAVAASEAWFSLGKDFLFVIFLLLLLSLFKKDNLHLLVKAVVALHFLTIATAVYNLWQTGATLNLAETYSITGSMGHRNLLASALALSLPFPLYASWHLHKGWKIAAIAGVLFSTVFIVLLQSRGAILGLGVFVFAFFALCLWRRFGSATSLKTIKITGISAGAVIFLMFGYFHIFGHAPTEDSFWELSGIAADNPDQEFTARERILIWEATGRMVMDQPPQGVGPGQWKIFFPKYGGEIWRVRQGMVQFQRPHNDFLWILSEQGIVGLLAFLGFLGSAVYFGLSFLIQSKVSREKDLAQLMLAMLCLYLAVSFFSFPRERIVHQTLLFVATAMILVLSKDFKTWAAPRKSTSRLSLIVVGVLLLPIIGIGHSRWKGEAHTQKILQAKAAADWPRILRHYETIKDSPFYQLDPTSVPVDFYAGLAYLNKDEVEKALAYFKEAHKLHPYNIHVVNNFASSYQLKGDFEKAIAYYEKALEIAPHYMDGVLNLSAAYFNEGQVQNAYWVLSRNEQEFTADSKEKYYAYMYSILSTIRDNLAEQTEDERRRLALKGLQREELIVLDRIAKEQNLPINEVIVQKAESTTEN